MTDARSALLINYVAVPPADPFYELRSMHAGRLVSGSGEFKAPISRLVNGRHLSDLIEYKSRRDVAEIAALQAIAT